MLSLYHVRNEEVLITVKEQRNILHEISKRKANWVGHILRRNCLLQQVTEGKIRRGIEVTQEDEEEDVGSYWMTLRKGEDTLV
jgi:chorismate mutase